jgi:hypothetical protein
MIITPEIVERGDGGLPIALEPDAKDCHAWITHEDSKVGCGL